jgi:hypothetical protein
MRSGFSEVLELGRRHPKDRPRRCPPNSRTATDYITRTVLPVRDDSYAASTMRTLFK